MKERSDNLKAIIASYWRYQRQCPVIALEVDWAFQERADVLVVTQDRFLIETENDEGRSRRARWKLLDATGVENNMS